MRRHYGISYFIIQGLKSFWRNGVMSAASVAVLMSCLVVLGGFSLLVATINKNLDDMGKLNEVVVFVNTEATVEQVDAVEQSIRALDNVDTVTKVTKSQALEEMKSQSESYEKLYEDITDENNPLPDSFNITYKQDGEKLITLVYNLNQLENVYKVNDRSDLAATISNFKSGVMLIFVWFLAILFIVSLFVIINTIKIAVMSRRHEISVMRYVGATKWFITLPFIVEGAVIGLLASVISYFVEWYAYSYVEKLAMGDLQMIKILVFSDFNGILLAGFLIIGVLTGVLGSCISLNKYLKS